MPQFFIHIHSHPKTVNTHNSTVQRRPYKSSARNAWHIVTRSSQQGHDKGYTIKKLGAINRKKENLGGSGPPPPKEKPCQKPCFFHFSFVRIKTHWEKLKIKIQLTHTHTHKQHAVHNQHKIVALQSNSTPAAAVLQKLLICNKNIWVENNQRLQVKAIYIGGRAGNYSAKTAGGSALAPKTEKLHTCGCIYYKQPRAKPVT